MQEIAAIGVEKYKYFLGENTPRPLPPTLNAIPHQTFCYQQAIYHFSTLGIVWSLFIDAPHWRILKKCPGNSYGWFTRNLLSLVLNNMAIAINIYCLNMLL
jgi:hypothetical protein